MPYLLIQSLMVEDYGLVVLIILWAFVTLFFQAIAGFRFRITKIKPHNLQDHPIINRLVLFSFSFWIVSFTTLFFYDFPLAIISALFGAIVLPYPIQMLVFDSIKWIQKSHVSRREINDLLQQVQSEEERLSLGRQRVEGFREQEGEMFVHKYSQNFLNIQPQMSNNADSSFGAYVDDPFIMQSIDQSQLLQLHLAIASSQVICLERALRRQNLRYDTVWELLWPPMVAHITDFWSTQVKDFGISESELGVQTFERRLPEIRKSLHVVELTHDEKSSFQKPSDAIASYLANNPATSRRIANRLKEDIWIIDMASVGILFKLAGSNPHS